jgi:PAS domain S-box-containing protein
MYLIGVPMRPIDPPALVEVNEQRKYVQVNDSTCRLLGYSREELLQMRIDDVSYPSGAHVSPMFEHYRSEGAMRGVFAVKTKQGEVLWIRYKSYIEGGRLIALWTEYEPVNHVDRLEQ